MRIINDSDILLLNIPMDRALENRESKASIQAMPPLGLLYIASSLQKNGFTVSFIDISVEIFEKNKLLDILLPINPKMIGISTYIESWNVQKEICKVLKKKFPKTVLIAGGHCATFCHEQLLEHTGFDFILKGEGEYSFVSLAQYLIHGMGTLDQVEGLVYKKNDIAHKNVEPLRISAIDQLPFPDRGALNFDLYSYPFTISTARGCPGRCIFCSSHAFWGNELCLRTPSNIIMEILEVYHRHHLKEFFIVDDTFTIKPKRTIEFCELLHQLQERENLFFTWGCESRADSISKELLEIMYNCGCKMIQFGMESGNDNILTSIKKGIKYKQIFNSVNYAYEIGINTNVSIILGHPEDTEETIRETLDKAFDLKSRFNANIQFSINTPYPGTELFEKSKELGVEILSKSLDQYRIDRPIINTKNLTANDLRKYFLEAHGQLYI